MRMRPLRMRLAMVSGLAACVLAGAALFQSERPAGAKEPALESLATEYAKEVRPLIQRYCQRCHSEKRSEAEVNLEAMTGMAEVRKHLRTWQKVSEMLD